LAEEIESKNSAVESGPSATPQPSAESSGTLPPQSSSEAVTASTIELSSGTVDAPKSESPSERSASGLPKPGVHLMPGDCLVGVIGDTQKVGLTSNFYEKLSPVVTTMAKAESSEDETVVPKPIFKSVPASKKKSFNRKKAISRVPMSESTNPEQLLKMNAQLTQECNALRQRVSDLEQCDCTSDILELICDNFCHCGKCHDGIDCLIRANHPWARGRHGTQDKLTKELIDHLTKRNKKLEQQVQELRQENEKLDTDNDCLEYELIMKGHEIDELTQKIEKLDTDNDCLEYELIMKGHEIDELTQKIESLSKGLADECEQRKTLERGVAEYESSFAKMNAENNRLFKENQALRSKSNNKLEAKVKEYEEAFAIMNAENNRLHKENQSLRAKQVIQNKLNSSKNEEILQSMLKLVNTTQQQIRQLQSLEQIKGVEDPEDTEAIKAFEVL
jgi:hypothetical protein